MSVQVSIIIVTYNQAALLADCLRSIYAWMPQQKTEIIIVDNNSCDATREIIKRDFCDVITILNERNQGFAKANNQGLAQASGKYIFLLNNDTQIKDDALNKMITYMDNHPEIGLLGPKLLNADGTIQAQGSLIGRHFWKAKEPVETSFLRGAAWLTTREVLDKVGYLDENFFFYGEDIDFCLRTKKKGYKIVYYPPAEIVHIGGKTSWRKQIWGLKGSMYLWKKMLFDYRKKEMKSHEKG